jgi:hypothetical protein
LNTDSLLTHINLSNGMSEEENKKEERWAAQAATAAE